ncbi:MAG: YihY/virulence factor BrkB family protein [Frankiaceae bacterium]|nr:YihY/virulence factor BrkB family protein [Frankiaceae bacterium]
MSLATTADAFQRRHRWASFPIGVIYKYNDDQGSNLAALITYYGFLSLFPLLLLLSSILGFVLRSDTALQHQVLHSTLAQFPIIGGDLAQPKRLGGHGFGLAVGIIGSLYGGMAVASAGQNAMNTIWAVPRNERPNPLTSRLRSLLLLATVGIGVLLTSVLAALAGSAHAYGATMGGTLRVVLTVGAVVVNAGLFLLAFRIATATDVAWRSLLPGACVAAVAWQLLQLFGTAYVGHVVKHASATDGVFALVLGLIAWIYLGAVVVLLCAESNVVRARELYPRALLTPFTDDVELTPGDERSYRDTARAQRFKGFQRIWVSFRRHDRDAADT